jgi:hypothetical protein
MVIASFPRELARIFFPFLAGGISLEEDRQFFLGKLVAIHAGIRFGDAMAFEKLNHSKVLTGWVFVHVCCYSVAIWFTRISRFSEKGVDLIFGLAEARESLIAQTGGENGNQYQGSLHKYFFQLCSDLHLIR